MREDSEDKLVNAIIALQQSMEKQLVKSNLLLAEHSRSILTLANKFDELHADVNGIRSEMKGMRNDINKLDSSFNKLDSSFNKLDGSFNKYAQSNDGRVNSHETRIAHLEGKTFGNSFVSEPRTEYKKRKKRK